MCSGFFFFDEYLLKHCHGLGNISEPLVFNLVKLDIMECQWFGARSVLGSGEGLNGARTTHFEGMEPVPLGSKVWADDLGVDGGAGGNNQAIILNVKMVLLRTASFFVVLI